MYVANGSCEYKLSACAALCSRHLFSGSDAQMRLDAILAPLLAEQKADWYNALDMHLKSAYLCSKIA